MAAFGSRPNESLRSSGSSVGVHAMDPPKTRLAIRLSSGSLSGVFSGAMDLGELVTLRTRPALPTSTKRAAPEESPLSSAPRFPVASPASPLDRFDSIFIDRTQARPAFSKNPFSTDSKESQTPTPPAGMGARDLWLSRADFKPPQVPPFRDGSGRDSCGRGGSASLSMPEGPIPQFVLPALSSPTVQSPDAPKYTQMSPTALPTPWSSPIATTPSPPFSRTPSSDKKPKVVRLHETSRNGQIVEKKDKRNVGTSARSHMCPECGKSFSQRGNLNRHRLIHLGVKPFRCSQCGKAFNQKIHLDKHERTHTGERPFECDMCGKAFTQRCTLRTHQKIHFR